MINMDKPFTVQIEGRGALSLTPNDFVAAGGEGRVFRKKNLAVKLWEDPGHAAKGRMPEKIKLLTALKHPCIVVPDALAYDSTGTAVGYVMPWVANGWALPLAFTNDWRNANSFGDNEAIGFAAKMREVTSFVHGRGVILGDGNELNILAVGTDPRYIDVDPWVMPGYPGDKIMPTIRDWHSAPFTKEADWYAWAVVTFQLLVGVHPYRGTHPGFKRNDVEGRMKANASVFDAAVRLSPAVRPFGSVPAALLDWYRAVFQDGARSLPPDPAASSTRSTFMKAATGRRTSGANLTVAELYGLASNILRMAAPDIIMLDGGLLVSLANGRQMGRTDPKSSVSRAADGSLSAIRADGNMVRFGLMAAVPGADMQFQDAGLAGLSTWSAENRLFVVVSDGLLEVQVRDLGSRAALLPGRKWSMNQNATVFGDGIAIYDALGARFFVAPFGPSAVAVVRVRELDGLKPISMVRRGRVAVMSLLDKAGAYHRAVALFSEDYSTYQIAVTDADDGSLTDAVTDTGVIVRFETGGVLELTMPASGGRREADAGPLVSSGRLLTGPSGVFVAAAGKVSKLSLI